ncbi:MAG TPA: hypothetical protein DCK76_11945 [Desulfotomaculum sp.]|nr:hypothetical protein [Desulfotomaculum sp.]HBY04192.1 hypothetical protein [Desulfotomaculum sp.]
MHTTIFRNDKAAEKLDSYRQVTMAECFFVDTDQGPAIFVFGCPEVKGLDPEARFSFQATAAIL